MARDAQPTNDRIVTLLEAIARQIGELRDAQKQMTADLDRVARASQ